MINYKRKPENWRSLKYVILDACSFHNELKMSEFSKFFEGHDS